MKTLKIKSIIAATLFVVPSFLLAKELKVGFYVDSEIKNNGQALMLEAKIDNAILGANLIYAQSHIDIQLKLAGIEYKNLYGIKNGNVININMMEGSSIFRSDIQGDLGDINQFRDFKGADFIFTIVNGKIIVNNDEYGGWSLLNGTTTPTWDSKKAQLGHSCIQAFMEGKNTDACNFSGGGRIIRIKTPKPIKKIDDAIHSAGSAVDDAVHSAGRTIDDDLHAAGRIIDDAGHYVFNFIPEPVIDYLEGQVEIVANYTLKITYGGLWQLCKAGGAEEKCEKFDIPNIGESKYYIGTLSNIDLDDHLLVHEMGHIMGMIHGEHVSAVCGTYQSPYDLLGEGLTKYSSGYGVGDCIKKNDDLAGGDIMNSDYFNPEEAVSKVFSSPIPNPNCKLPGGVCGSARADTVRAINEHLPYYDNQDTDVKSLHFGDAGFAQCISATAPKEVYQFKSLSCGSKKIVSLDGIAELTALENINLDNNEIRDISALLKLNPSKVKSISLKGNNQVMCHQLDELQAKFNLASLIKPDNCFNVGAFVAINNLLLR